jgi:hypothetical protein
LFTLFITPMEQKKHVDDLHQLYTGWLKDLAFYKDELGTFGKRLEEVVTQNNKKEVLARVEHFQNQFIRQNELIDVMKHNYNQKELELVSNVKANPIASDRVIYQDPADLKEEFETFERIYREMKVEFESFLSKTL